MAANPVQYALNNIGRKAQELFNPVGQAISRVPQQFGNYLQQSAPVQGAQMYQRAFQSPQVQNVGQQFLNAQRPSIQGLNTARQIVTPFVKANANILGQGLMSWQRSTPHGQALQQLSQNLPTSSTNPVGNTYLKALAPFRKPTSIEDVGNIASAVYGAPKVVANTIGGGIGYGINKFTKEQSDANAFQGGYEFSSKIGGIGKLLETPLAGLVKRLNPTVAQSIGQLIDKGQTKEAFKQLWKNVGASTITSGIEGTAYGATQQAKNVEQWAKNIFDNATQFAAFGGGTSLVSGLGTIGAKTVWNKGGSVVRAGQNVLNKAMSGKVMPSGLQMANAEINSPMDKDDVQAIFNIHKRASESWMTKNKKLDLNQHAKDMNLVDGMLVDNYGASVKEVKSMSAKEKIDTLFSIARQDSGIAYSDIKLPKQPPKELEGLMANKAIKKYGTTTIPESASFVTQDGKIIDSSGKRLGSMSEGRNVDHREIAVDSIPLNAETQGMSGSDALSHFMDKAKTTRVNVTPNEINIDTIHNLSDAQFKELEKLSQGREIVADISRIDGSVAKSGTFKTFEEYKKFVSDFFNQSKGVQEADLSIKIPEPPVSPELKVVNGKIKMKPIEGPKIEMPTTPNIPPENSPVQKIIQAIKEAKPLRKEQEALYSAERSKRLGQVIGVGKNMKGEAGYFGQLSKLKGEMPKVQFDPIRTNLKQGEVDQLFNQIRDSKYITEWEKINAQTGLSKLLGKEGGVIPTEGEIHLLNEVYGQEFTQALLDKRSRGAKLLDMAGNILNVPRTLMASFDLSAPLRQGWGLMGKPKQFGGAVKEMFTDLRSEKSYSQLLQSIKDHPNYLKMREGGLSLAQQGPLLTSREERFMSNYAEQIPGVGHIVRGSDRAYTGFLNKLRSDSFNDMLDKAINSGAPDTAETYKAIANFVNTATGRGSLGALNKASAVLSNALFSPRLMASRFQMMNPMTYVNLPPQVRQQALRAVLGSAAMALSAVGIAKMGGAEVGSDPRSADFGKIKVGNTRYDLWAGFQQPIRALSQIISGKVISTTTGREMTLGEGYKPMTRLDIVWNFLQSKESPVASFIMGMMQGQNGIGQPFNVPEEVISRMTPMILSDMFDLYQEHGVKGLAMAVPGAFGVGSQTYSWTPTSKEDKMQAAAMKEGGASNKDINNYLLEQTRRKVQMQQQKEELKKQVEPPILDIPSTAPKSLEQTIWDKVKGIIPNAEAGGINPKMAMPDQGQPNTAVPQVKTKESTGPSTASSMVLSDIQEEGIKNNLKYSNGRVEVIGNKIFIKGDNDTTIKVVDVGAAQPTGNAIQQAKQVATHQSQIGSVGVNAYFSQKLSDSDKNEIYKALGTNAQEVEFKALASLPDDKQASVLYNLLKDRKWKQEKVDAFIKSDVLTNSVVGKMEDQGLINESQAKDLKAYIKSTSIKLGKVSAGSGKKAKKIKMPKLKTIKVKYSKLKIKIPKPKKYKALLSKGKSNKYFK